MLFLSDIPTAVLMWSLYCRTFFGKFPSSILST
jgi:hypothetical protein